MKPVLIIHTAKVVKGMNKIRDKTPYASKMAMLRAVEMLKGYIVKNKLRGQYLKRRTGHLAGSMSTEVLSTRGEVIGRVGSNLKYARIHELGGVIPAHTIYPVKAEALHFYMGGNEIFCKSANIPEMKMRARHYIGHSMKEYRDNLQRIIGQKFWSEVTSE